MRVRDDAERLLADLLTAGAIPAMERDRLQIAGPPGVLTRARRTAIAAALPELRAIVITRWRSREECAARHPCRLMSPCARPVDGRPCLVPATCCVCEGLLPPGRRYLCPTCADATRTTATHPKGDCLP